MQIDLSQYWYRKNKHALVFFLWPLAFLFGLLAALRRFFYRVGVFKVKRFSVPVIVVGNITVGGTGKTPFVIWLATLLKQLGYRPGIVSRGVGGEKHHAPHLVRAEDEAALVGDEALLLLKRSDCPVMLGIDRAQAVSALLKTTNCNIVISDDGLQHYGLGRDLEIAIIDGERRFGNACLLPMGPLRESLKRLKTVDMVVVNGGMQQASEFSMQLHSEALVSLHDGSSCDFLPFPEKKIHAFAAIGHPERFFNTLRQAGFTVIPHVFPDHYLYQASDFMLDDDLPIIMTEKDAVKCAAFAKGRCWYLSVTAELQEKAVTLLIEKLNEIASLDEKRRFVNGMINIY